MITVPVIDLLHGAPAGEYRTGRVDFVNQVSGRPARTGELPFCCGEPGVQ
jgi:hypothetical protein